MAKAKVHLSKIAKEQRGENHYNWKGGVKYDVEYQRKYRREWKRNKWKELKQRVIEKYGGRCQCCGITYPEFLTIDHINRDGKEHRKMKKNTHNLYLDIYKLPLDNTRFRLLCMNCNFAIRNGDICPHKKYEKQLVNN